jgi:hypothetical protein
MEYWRGVLVKATLVRLTAVVAVLFLVAPGMASGRPTTRVSRLGSLTTGMSTGT